MAPSNLQHSYHHTQTHSKGNLQQQQRQEQSLKEIGAQFNDTKVDYAGASKALDALPSNPYARSSTLAAVLGRTDNANKAKARLLASDVVASLSSTTRK
ncbi:hypothetical protein F4806DRAFT_141170 [Annulohypoxylon nitens]|nr:hypothetical protein F4806DRAFT_141170 [Annulohypoxylon nitens]